VWSAGCASGQEAYSIAMLLAEALGDEAFRERVKIYAHRRDEEALAQARQAAYTREGWRRCRRRCASATSIRRAGATCSGLTCAAR
jgi:chemotaxis methyl-accepting protein methylase